MRLVYCIPSLYRAGGMERVLTDKVRAWAEDAKVESITIVTTERVPDGQKTCFFPLPDSVEVVAFGLDFDGGFRLPLWRKTLRHLYLQCLYLKRLTALLRERKADLCISMGGKELEWLGRVRGSWKTLVELHFCVEHRAKILTTYHHGYVWEKIGQWRVRQMARQIERLDRCVVLTQADKQRLEAMGCQRVSVIHNPSTIAPRMRCTAGSKQVLAVGRLGKEKGFERLLQVWQRVQSQRLGWTLLIAGEGEERESLEAMRDALGLSDTVQMPGVINDMEALYAQSAMLAMSSHHEGLPLTIIEAMACGLAVVSMDCPDGPRELIEHGVTGLLVANGDIEAMARAIIQLMEDEPLRLAMGEKGVEKIEQEMTIERIMGEWRGLVNGVNGDASLNGAVKDLNGDIG